MLVCFCFLSRDIDMVASHTVVQPASVVLASPALMKTGHVTAHELAALILEWRNLAEPTKIDRLPTGTFNIA